MTPHASAVEKGLSYLRRSQQTDGGFTGSVSTDQTNFSVARVSPTVFVSALIGQMLGGVTGTRDIRRGIADFLTGHKRPRGSWNYWRNDPAGRKMRPYPDDLDDTACAWAAVTAADIGLFDADAQAGFGKLLIAAEQAPGGPYRTWLVGPDAAAVWRDVDIAVNANILSFCHSLGLQLPGTTAYIAQALGSDRPLTSPYYPSETVIMYLCARVNREFAMLAAQRMKRIKSDQAPGLLTGLLELNIRLRAGVRPECMRLQIDHLLKAQSADGSWPPAGFYIESDLGETLYGGSAALTTALVLETLALAAADRQPPAASSRLVRGQSSFRAARASALKLEHSAVRTMVTDALVKLEQRDHDRQIGSIARELERNIGANVPLRITTRLDQGSIYGWLAYSLYDDILDGEDEAVQWLGVANVTARSCLESFRTALPRSVGFQRFVGQVLDKVDAANTWELRYTRLVTRDSQFDVRQLPDYGNFDQLADRSWGHVLSTVGVLVASGYDLHGSAVRHWLDFFRHFIIARQLHDDAHDWPDDLANGRLTAVVVMLLQAETLPAIIDPAKDLSRLKQRFWRETADLVAVRIEKHIYQAEQALSDCTFLVADQRYREYLNRLKRGVRQMQDERQAAETFMAAFNTAV